MMWMFFKQRVMICQCPSYHNQPLKASQRN